MTEVPAWARFRSFRKHGAIAQQPFYTTFHVAHKSTNKGTHETEKRVARMSLREPRLLCKYGCSLARAPISIRNVAAVTRRSSPIFVSTALILFQFVFIIEFFFSFFIIPPSLLLDTILQCNFIFSKNLEYFRGFLMFRYW